MDLCIGLSHRLHKVIDVTPNCSWGKVIWSHCVLVYGWDNNKTHLSRLAWTYTHTQSHCTESCSPSHGVYMNLQTRSKTHPSELEKLDKLRNIRCPVYFSELFTPSSVSTLCPLPSEFTQNLWAFRSSASGTLGNLSAILFPLTGGITSSLPALAPCSAR